jgi:hypothetical protein
MVNWYLRNGNVCVDTENNCHSSTIVRVYPPNTGSRYTALVQTFKALPNTSYKVSMLVNSRYGGPAAGGPGIQVWYQGVNLGTHDCNTPATTLYFHKIDMWELTTDSTGVGKMEIRVLNRGGASGAYFYLDDVMVIKK